MSQDFDVSVIVPAYRAGGFIHRAIDSAFGQSGVRVQVVVVDDACPDATWEAVETRYGERPDLEIVRLRVNSGPAAARNAGIGTASAPWVAVLDADDAFDEGRLERLVRQGEDLGADAIADNVRLFDPVRGVMSEPRITSVSAPEQLSLHALARGARPGTGELDFGLLKPMFRREHLVSHGITYPEHVRHGEDFLLYLELVRAGGRFFVVPEPGYAWTVRSSGQSQTVVDYPSQVGDVRRLQKEFWVENDPQLYELLDQRATALLRLHESWKYAEAVKERRYLRALLACIQHPFLLRRAVSSLRSRMGAAA